MKRPRQPGLFDVEKRASQLAKMNDLLVSLNARQDWKAFLHDLSRVHEKESKRKAGEPNHSMLR